MAVRVRRLSGCLPLESQNASNRGENLIGREIHINGDAPDQIGTIDRVDRVLGRARVRVIWPDGDYSWLPIQCYDITIY